MRAAWLFLILICASVPAAAQQAIDLGRAEAPLYGPWTFALGDDPRRADPGFDDRRWERVGLAPAPGAHDPDVGLVGYVPGWMQRGHAGYHGFAWYRLHIRWSAPTGGLVLLGPPMVDDAYQVYWNGRLLGGIGDFRGARPIAYAAKPLLLSVPESGASGEAVVAVRVFLSPSVGRDGDAGGIHIAPILATREAGEARFAFQWSRTFLGYVVDAVEPALLLLLAAFALFALLVGRDRPLWLCMALALAATAALRLNQVLFFWFSFESIEAFAAVKYVLLEPLGLLLWTMAWNRWSGAPLPRLERLALWSANICALAAFAGDPLATVRLIARLNILLCLTWTGLRIARNGPDRGPALAAMLLVAVGQFAEELWALGFAGIWFPFGVGVSRTQYALAALVPLLAILFARRALRSSFSTAAGVPA